MATQPERLTKEFRGRTEVEVVTKFMMWKHETWGRIRILKEHPIEHLPLDMQPQKFGQPNLGKVTNAWSMLVDYENIAVGNEKKSVEPTPQKRKKPPTRKHR
jgi:hypothetical protein